MLAIRRALSANFLPALVLWTAAFGLLALYELNAPTQAALNWLAMWKQRLGLGFSMPAQAFAAGLLPFLFQNFQKGNHRKTAAIHVPFLMLVFACTGAMNDLFYSFQAVLFGNNSQPLTIIYKVALDMLVFTPTCSMPIVVLAFAFKDNDFSPKRTQIYLGKNWLLNRVSPVYFTALVVWTPAAFVLYALPLALQFPFQAIIQCLWGLILVVLTAEHPEAAEVL